MDSSRESERARRILTWGLSLYVFSTLISMAVMSIGAVLLFVALLVAFGGPRKLSRRVFTQARSPASRCYLRASAVLAGVCFLSLIVAWLAPLGYGDNFPRIRPVLDGAKLWYLFWPLLPAMALVEVGEGGRKVVLRTWLLTYGALAVIGIQQHWTGWPRPQLVPGTDHLFHATLFLGTHLTVASVLIFPFFAGLDLLRERGRELPLPRALLFVMSALGLWALVFTESRTLWAALPVGLALWAVLALPRRWAAGLSVGITLLALAASQLPAVQLRFSDRFGFDTREELWKANLELFSHRPITGVGFLHNHELSGYYLMTFHPGQSVFSGHAHNNLLDMLAGTGVLGLTAWIFWSVLVVWLAWRARVAPLSSKEGRFALGLVCAWVVLQLNGLTQVNFWEAKVTHQLMLAVAWSLAWLQEPDHGTP